MSAASIHRQVNLEINVGKVSIVTILAYIGARSITVINPVSAAIYTASASVIYLLGQVVFKNSPNIKNINIGIIIGAWVVCSYVAGITLLNALVINAIVIVVREAFEFLNRNIG